MPKLSDEQIETTIASAHANIIATTRVTQDERVIDRAITRELRACFTAGQDNGQQLILERAAELVAQPVADERTLQIGRSMVTILAWVAKVKGRMFSGAGETFASVLRADSDPKSEDGFFSQYIFGSDANEALAKLAGWCAEQMHNSVGSTEPAPPEPTLPDNDPPDAQELCENRATVDAAINEAPPEPWF